MNKDIAIQKLSEDCGKMNLECDCKGTECSDCYINYAITKLQSIEE